MSLLGSALKMQTCFYLHIVIFVANGLILSLNLNGQLNLKLRKTHKVNEN